MLYEMAIETIEVTPNGLTITHDKGHGGMCLHDFVKHENVTRGKLELPHVAALRLYTSSSFAQSNGLLYNFMMFDL